MASITTTPDHRLPCSPKHRGSVTALIWPAFVVLAFFGLPALLLIRVSLARRDPSVLEGTGWTLDSFAAAMDFSALNGFLQSLQLAFAVATVSTILAFPAVYFITRMRRSAQVAWLVGLLTTLALSEVLITFAWQVVLSKRAGLSNIGVLLGLLDKTYSMTPSFYAVVACLVYVVIPLNAIMLYPSLSRIDASYMEVAATMGAKPWQAFFNVLIPLLKRPIATGYLTAVVISLGSYVAPLVLGSPSNWTIGVVISELATSAQNLPGASATAILLLVMTLIIIAAISRVGGKGYTS
ncbi:ABC transporter permease [Sinorhizobium meliloti]|uniref:ABC transporter permease n=1 Tax=Rhizobium meliloti TaxID=382 RepID=UPI003D657EB9